MEYDKAMLYSISLVDATDPCCLHRRMKEEGEAGEEDSESCGDMISHQKKDTDFPLADIQHICCLTIL